MYSMRIVVSLTTLPGREDLVWRAIESIQCQTCPPDAIYLNLPSDRFAGSRVSFRFEGVTLCLLPDIGPAMKLLPTLAREKDPNTFIITIDDDVEYPPQLIDKLVRAAVLFPNSAIGFTGWSVTPIKDEIPEIWHMNQDIAGCRFFQPVQVLEGTRGVIYRRNFFDNDILDHACALSSFRFHDDILFSGYLASRDIGRIVRWFDTLQGHSVSNWKIHGQSDGLHTTHNWYQLGRDCWDYWATSGAYDKKQLPGTPLPPRRITIIEEGIEIPVPSPIPCESYFPLPSTRSFLINHLPPMEKDAVDEILILGRTAIFLTEAIIQITPYIRFIKPGTVIQAIISDLECVSSLQHEKIGHSFRISDSRCLVHGHGQKLPLKIIDRYFDISIELDPLHFTLTLVRKAHGKGN